MRAPIGCTPGTVKTGVMLSEMSGRWDAVMRGAADAADVKIAAQSAATAVLRVISFNVRIGEPLALELQRRLHLAQRSRLGLSSTRVRAVERLEALRQLAQRLRREVRVVPVGGQ